MTAATALAAVGFVLAGAAGLTAMFGSLVTLEGMRANRGKPRFAVWDRRNSLALRVFDWTIGLGIAFLAASLVVRLVQ